MTRETLRPETSVTAFMTDLFRETNPHTAGVTVSWEADLVAIRLRAFIASDTENCVKITLP